MASSGQSHKLKKTESKKSHSWLWDSHIVPKNNKWLQDNLEEMDQYVKRMLKLIEEDADSFSKKAELYFKKRPELLSLVEEFYRMYRSLAERHDHVTGELRKRVPSDIQSQDSGISEADSELPSSMPSPDHRPSCTKSDPRAAGFNFFLGGRKSSSDFHSSKGEQEDESSSLDSESESDDSSKNSYSGTQSNDEERELRKKILELEDEIRDLKERVKLQEQDISEGSKKPHYNSDDEVEIKMADLEEKLRTAKEKVQISEEEITHLKDELHKYKSLAEGKDQSFEDDTLKSDGSEVLKVENRVFGEPDEIMSSPEAEISDSTGKIRVLEEELRIMRENLAKSEEKVARSRRELLSKGDSIRNMQDQLNSVQKEVSSLKSQLENDKGEVTKLQDRITRYKTNLSKRDQEIIGLKEAKSKANKTLSEENVMLQAEITRITKEKTYLEHKIKELDLLRQSLEEELRREKAGTSEMKEVFGTQIEQLKIEISDKNNRIEELNKEFDALRLKYDSLMAVKDNINAKIETLGAEISSRDDRIDQMNKHLHDLHVQHFELICKAQEAKKIEDELNLRVKNLEIEIEKKQQIILEGAEEKREAIRQLCFSLEHYRHSYNSLRKAVIARKQTAVMAS